MTSSIRFVVLAGALAGLSLSGCSRTTVFFCGTPEDPPCPTGFVCVANRCVVDPNPQPCATGTTRCNGQCVNTTSDAANCGACGTACPSGQACQASMCRAGCTGGLTNCNGTCVNAQTDKANCGACGTACSGLEQCATGRCQCSAPLTQCANGACVKIGRAHV